MNIKLLLGVALLSMILLVSSCNEDQSFQPDFSRYTLFSVSLTDNPICRKSISTSSQSSFSEKGSGKHWNWTRKQVFTTCSTTRTALTP